MNNSEDITKVYISIGNKIDNYIKNWGVDPKNLKSYLSGNRLKRFLESEGLGDLSGAERIVNDIIEDRISLEREMVKTFESFNLEVEETTNKFWVGVGKANLEHEKILADYFDISLSEIDIVDTNTHKFSASGKEVVVFTKGDLEKISENLKMGKISQINKQEIGIFTDINIKLSEVLDPKKLDSVIDDLVSSGLHEMIKQEMELTKIEKFGNSLVGMI